MIVKLLVSLCFALCLMVPMTAKADPTPASPILMAQANQPLSPEAVLERLFTTATLEANWFDDRFLSQVSLAEVEQVLQGLQRSLGAYQRVEPQAGNYLVIFDRGTSVAQLYLTPTGQIGGLLFQAPQLAAISLEEVIAEFQALPGRASLLVLQGDTERAAYNPDDPLAVGSAFKLVVLNALQQQIEAGDHQWDEVVTLQPEWRSLPSGILQTWPSGASITLQSLATLMISLSDNTATDALIHLVGRDELEARSPRNQPFLTTREAFILKNPTNQALLNRYQAANPEQRRQLLAQSQTAPLPPPELFGGAPLALDVEWFLTARELCHAIAPVADLPLMQIEPGLADPADWSQIAFKGGSEPGVINFTTRLQAEDGQSYCVTATWNNPDGIDQTQFATLYRSAIAALH